MASIVATAPGWFRVLDLARMRRCENCGAKGRAVVNARRALRYDKLE